MRYRVASLNWRCRFCNKRLYRAGKHRYIAEDGKSICTSNKTKVHVPTGKKVRA